MQKVRLSVKRSRRYRVTTDSRHHHPVAPNLLNRHFDINGPDKVWASDITYLWTREGCLYLVGHKDLCTGEIVGYAMGERLTKSLVSQSLFRAVAAKRPAKGLIHHSDRGSQYCSYEYRELLERFGMRALMSRKGNCY